MLTPQYIGIGVLVLCFICLLLVCGSRRETQEKRQRNVIDQRCAEIAPEETIFVSIVARSPDVAYVICNMFEESFCPFRVFVGVCQLVGSQYVDLLEEYATYVTHKHDFSDNIRVFSVAANAATNPRALIEQHLYRGEKYYLHVDADVIFNSFWDKECVSQLQKCHADKPMLTMIPLAAEFGKKHKPSFLRLQEGKSGGLINLEGVPLINRPQSPIPSPFLSGLFVFSYATSFWGVGDSSDYVLSAAFWTRGYDFFHPTTMIVSRMLNPKAPQPHTSPPSLGTVRSLGAFEAWCGVKMWPTFVAAPTAYAGMNVVQSEPEQIQQKYGSRKLYQQYLFRAH